MRDHGHKFAHGTSDVPDQLRPEWSMVSTPDFVAGEKEADAPPCSWQEKQLAQGKDSGEEDDLF